MWSASRYSKPGLAGQWSLTRGLTASLASRSKLGMAQACSSSKTERSWSGLTTRPLPIRSKVEHRLGRLKESSHESCQIAGIRWRVGVQRRTDADDRARRGPGEDPEYRRQSSGSC